MAPDVVGFLSEDPLTHPGSPGSLHHFLRGLPTRTLARLIAAGEVPPYTYARSDPISYRDPTGLYNDGSDYHSVVQFVRDPHRKPLQGCITCDFNPRELPTLLMGEPPEGSCLQCAISIRFGDPDQAACLSCVHDAAQMVYNSCTFTQPRCPGQCPGGLLIVLP